MMKLSDSDESYPTKIRMNEMRRGLCSPSPAISGVSWPAVVISGYICVNTNIAGTWSLDIHLSLDLRNLTISPTDGSQTRVSACLLSFSFIFTKFLLLHCIVLHSTRFMISRRYGRLPFTSLRPSLHSVICSLHSSNNAAKIFYSPAWLGEGRGVVTKHTWMNEYLIANITYISCLCSSSHVNLGI